LVIGLVIGGSQASKHVLEIECSFFHCVIYISVYALHHKTFSACALPLN
jgi:hypothetical protein